jgi:trans-aconitate 2-methyltransferase
MADAWDPRRYEQFRRERTQPFLDLMGLVEGGGFDRAVDLGCGTGELTVLAADRLGITQIVGVDSSPAMLAAAGERSRADVTFVPGDIASWTSTRDHDLVLANASLQWVGDHAGVLARWTAALRPGGQLAVQVPANAGMPSHVVAEELARSDRYAAEFGEAGPPPDPVGRNVLEPEVYAELLFELGYADQHVRLQVYPHLLGSSRNVVDWVRGTTLNRFAAVLAPDVFEAFVADYDTELVRRIGDRSPYLFAFRRILLWGRRQG